ncbi:hypothetical protein [Nocardioides sp. 503]|uniref:hypothetical protein n=1 Tax=Nocardioides sp. 503 TaxID=2508326 RepID=UPI001FD63E5D|nr:hypothetical protein [Nocardioides sp. 503]
MDHAGDVRDVQATGDERAVHQPRVAETDQHALVDASPGPTGEVVDDYVVGVLEDGAHRVGDRAGREPGPGREEADDPEIAEPGVV